MKLFYALFILALSISTSAHAQITCTDLFVNPNAVERLRSGFAALGSHIDQRLPAPQSLVWDHLKRSIQSAMNPSLDPFERASGWVELNTRDLFDVEQIDALYRNLPADFAIWDLKHSSKNENSVGEAADVIAPLQGYVSWVTQLLRSAVPGERLILDRAELRYSNGVVDPSAPPPPSSFHIDGGKFTVLLTLKGSSTRYLDAQHSLAANRTLHIQEELIQRYPMRQAATGDTLIISNDARQGLGIPGTLHASPIERGERLLLLLRFYEQPLY